MFDTASILSLFVMGLLSINSFVFPTFTEKFIGLNSPNIILLYCVFVIVLKILNKEILPDKIHKIITLFVFPVTLVASIIFFVLEKTQYPNYVFEHTHIFTQSFVYIVLFGLVVLVFSKRKYKTGMEKTVSLLFFFSLIVFAFLQINKNDLFQIIVLEDSALEYMQFLLDLLAGFFALRIFLYFKKNEMRGNTKSIIFFFISIALFFIAFEEISWGQRIFGIATPESVQIINAQKELNIHNLSFFQLEKTFIVYMMIGLYGSLSRIFSSWLFPNKKTLEIYTPDKILFPFFFIVFLVYFDRSFLNINFETLSGQSISLLPWQEISEGYLSIGVFIYLFSTYKKVVSTLSRKRR